MKFYNISWLYAPTPQAKGKGERRHQFCQNRLPVRFAAQGVRDIPQANPWVPQLRRHHRYDPHRELAMIPHQASELLTRDHESATGQETS